MALGPCVCSPEGYTHTEVANFIKTVCFQVNYTQRSTKRGLSPDVAPQRITEYMSQVWQKSPLAAERSLAKALDILKWNLHVQKRRRCWSAGQGHIPSRITKAQAQLESSGSSGGPSQHVLAYLRNWLVGGYHGQENLRAGICCVLLPTYGGRAHINSDSASCFLPHVSLSALPKKGRPFL